MTPFVLLLISDGREPELTQCMSSAVAALPRPAALIHVDDADHRLGFAGAVAAGWDAALATGLHWIFHLEQDFIFNDQVDLEGMIGVLTRHPHLAQVALKRQPWNAEEIRAGGIVEQHPDDFIERRDDQAVWTEHRRFFTTNPSVYHRSLCDRGWPQTRESEGIFTHALLVDRPGVRFAFWGGKFDAPRVHHIGAVRAGHSY